MEGPHEVLRPGVVDGDFAAQPRVDHRQQGCGDVDERDAPRVGRGGEPRRVEHRAAADRHHDVRRLDAVFAQRGEHAAEDRERLRLLPGGHLDPDDVQPAVVGGRRDHVGRFPRRGIDDQRRGPGAGERDRDLLRDPVEGPGPQHDRSVSLRLDADDRQLVPGRDAPVAIGQQQPGLLRCQAGGRESLAGVVVQARALAHEIVDAGTGLMTEEGSIRGFAQPSCELLGIGGQHRHLGVPGQGGELCLVQHGAAAGGDHGRGKGGGLGQQRPLELAERLLAVPVDQRADRYAAPRLRAFVEIDEGEPELVGGKAAGAGLAGSHEPGHDQPRPSRRERRRGEIGPFHDEPHGRPASVTALDAASIASSRSCPNRSQSASARTHATIASATTAAAGTAVTSERTCGGFAG
jgi:hypothetical protein